MSPLRRSTIVETGDHSPRNSKLAPIVASPRRIKTIAPDLCYSMTTITKTARTRASASARASGSPFAASGPARKIAQSSRTRRAVKLESLTRSCHARIDFRALFTASESRRWSRMVMNLFDRAKLRRVPISDIVQFPA